MHTVRLLLESAVRKMDEGENPETVWEEVKNHIATFLREETTARAQPSIQAALELKATRIHARKIHYPGEEHCPVKRPPPNAHVHGGPRQKT